MILKNFFSILIITLATQLTTAQTAEEIIANYLENTGGEEAWKNLEGLKMSATASQGGMEIPVVTVQLKDGRQMTTISFQGKEIKQGEAEESDAESTENFKLALNDFPSPFLDYKKKGYTVELMGKEDMDGTETFKVKLVTEPQIIDGKKEESVSFYFFDTENFVPIAMQSEIKSGQAKGMISETTYSDYDEVDGLYFPFSITQGVKGMPGQPISFSKIETNPKKNKDSKPAYRI
jgi:hypothetical protein